MQRHKSQRHVHAAQQRWRAAERRADAERAAGIPNLPMPVEIRQPFMLPFAHLGYRDVRIEPRLGYVAWRAIDAGTGELLHCAALKETLRWLAGQVPRLLATQNFA